MTFILRSWVSLKFRLIGNVFQLGSFSFHTDAYSRNHVLVVVHTNCNIDWFLMCVYSNAGETVVVHGRHLHKYNQNNNSSGFERKRAMGKYFWMECDNKNRTSVRIFTRYMLLNISSHILFDAINCVMHIFCILILNTDCFDMNETVIIDDGIRIEICMHMCSCESSYTVYDYNCKSY